MFMPFFVKQIVSTYEGHKVYPKTYIGKNYSTTCYMLYVLISYVKVMLILCYAICYMLVLFFGIHASGRYCTDI